MRYVLPTWIVLNGIVKLRRSRSEGVYAIAVRASAPLRIRVAVKDSLLNFTLKARPLFFWRLMLHLRRTL